MYWDYFCHENISSLEKLFQEQKKDQNQGLFSSPLFIIYIERRTRGNYFLPLADFMIKNTYLSLQGKLACILQQLKAVF